MLNACFVGGGAGLIGRHIVKSFKDEGRKVYALDLKSEHEGQRVDLTDERAVASFFDKNFKDVKRSTLINCQAIADPFAGPLWELKGSVWKDYISRNLDSYFHTCKHFIRNCIERKIDSASIINVSSTRRLMAEPNTEPYCATKGAITSFTKALAISCGEHGIRVNSISPGWIASEDADLRNVDHSQHPAGRVGTPDDVARACLFLSDPRNSFLTGHDLVLDGGMTSKMIYQD